MDKLTRRDFLKFISDGLLTLTGLLGLAGLVRFLSFELDPAPPTEYDLGPMTNYPVNSTSMLLHIPAVLIHKPDGFSALSLTCTHLGCTVEQKSDSFECPCHGSMYDNQGEVQKGPAKLPLKRLRVTTTEQGNLLLHMN
jgi:nitrite reductase/ring-hydroxylating ferredoxin subunit